MIRTTTRASSMCIAAIVGALCVVFFGGTASGQSDVVFLSISGVPSARKLVRFDAGVQTFAVTEDATGITTLFGEVLAADFGGPIKRFSPNGGFLGNFATPAENQLFIESDSNGNVYTSPGGPGFATRYDSAGNVTQTYSISGTLVGIDADALGNVYLAQQLSGSANIVKFAPNGTLINSTAIPNVAPIDFAIDELGSRLFMVNGSGSASAAAIRIYNIAGAAPTFLGTMATPANITPFGIDFAEDSGNILISDLGFSNNNIARGLEYSPTGTLLREYLPTPNAAAWDILAYPAPEPSSAALTLAGIFGAALCAYGTRRGRSQRAGIILP